MIVLLFIFGVLWMYMVATQDEREKKYYEKLRAQVNPEEHHTYLIEKN